MFTLNERSPSFCFRQFERELKPIQKKRLEKNIKEEEMHVRINMH